MCVHTIAVIGSKRSRLHNNNVLSQLSSKRPSTSPLSRRIYATLRIAKGDNILDVSKQLGHHFVKIALDIYAHWMPRANKCKVDKLDLRTTPFAPYPQPRVIRH